MKHWQWKRVTLLVLAFVGAFLLALAATSTSLIWNTRAASLSESEGQAVRFVNGAETALNRSLLGIDVLMANMDDLLGLSKLLPRSFHAQTASQLMHVAADLNLLVNDVALINAEGQAMASSTLGNTTLSFNLPTGFVQAALAQPISTLVVSAPRISLASAGRVLYLARHTRFADGSKVLVVAEVQLAHLTTILTQGVDINGLEVTFERSNGQLLVSSPTDEQLSGQQLSPALHAQPSSSPALRMAARLSGAPALVVTRPLLYPDLLISASIPIATALAQWRVQRNLIVGVTLVFAVMILLAGGFVIWHLGRLAQSRRSALQSKTTLEQALGSMVSGFVLLNADFQVVSWNQRFTELYPWLAKVLAPLLPFQKALEIFADHALPHASAIERQDWIKRRKALQQEAKGTHEQRLPNGQVIEITERRTPEGGLVITYQDVTALRKATSAIEQLAFFDPLTGLPNRRLLMDRLQHALATSVRSGRSGALLFLDLDNFKAINDTLGHDVGDLLLQQVAQRLTASVRDEDTVARLGGDEFVIMLEDLSSHSQEAAAMARRIGEKIIDRLNYPYELAGHNQHNTPSVGAVLFGGATQTAADLLKQADIAMYQVKLKGRNDLCFFDPQMQAAITAHSQLEEDMHAALANEEFELYYQPQIDIEGHLQGAEVLIRWNHPTRGLVPPVEFIPVAEESDLILHIGLWVLRTACQQLAAWQNQGHRRALHLAINVSARQFRQPTFVAEVAKVMHDTGVRPDRLKLELTESLVLDNVDDAIAKMSELKALGVRFAVDDFGTGQSSLAYLTRLPLDQLKIDQSFVRNIGIQHSDGVIVQTIIGMTRNLGLEVIAEGVETPAQHAFLALHGCTLYQGYLLGKPTPLAEFEALLGPAPTDA